MHMMLITTDRKLALGARLSGMATEQVDEVHPANEAWHEALDDPELGALFVSGELAEELSEEIATLRERESLPLVYVLPAEKEE
ncbi:MAG: V-type ATP synthase subunit F [Peptoniphilaceae bacterium]|nr:V-type ATP synthase subunit F [Peptoniphilaceae bacterium]